MKHPEDGLGRKSKLQTRSRSRRRVVRSPGAASELAQLRSLARACGIQTSYSDVAGQKQEASPETLRALLRIFGIPADGSQEIRAALQERRSQAWRRWSEPVIVSWDGEPTKIELRLPVSSHG